MPVRSLFVTGMFRSGTTLLARMLNAHPSIALASDPFLPFLKHLRDEIAVELFGRDRLIPQAPLDDYFASADGLALRRAIEAGSLDRPLPIADRDRLWPLIRDYAEPFSRNLAARVDEIRGATCRDCYESMLCLVGQVYGRGQERYRGHKEVWAGEFTAGLHRAFPEMRSIHVVRDPRAVCASKNVAADRYPWLFLVRQWRKLASLAWAAVNDSSHRESCLLIRYEDLVGDPGAAARRICDFLEIEFDGAMTDPQHLRDGDDRRWQRNSSYAELNADPAISNRAVHRWKTVLSDREISFIERLTFPLMTLFDYEPLTPVNADIPETLLWDPPCVPPSRLTEWIRPHVRVDEVTAATELGKEILRMRLLGASEKAPSGDLIESMFYSRALFEVCRDLTSRPAQRSTPQRAVRRRKLIAEH